MLAMEKLTRPNPFFICWFKREGMSIPVHRLFTASTMPSTQTKVGVHLNKSLKFQHLLGFRRSVCITCQILWWSVKPLLRNADFIYWFSEWWPVSIFDLLWVHWDHLWRILDGLYCFATFGWNRCSNFNDASFNILRVWLENAYSCGHALKM